MLHEQTCKNTTLMLIMYPDIQLLNELIDNSFFPRSVTSASRWSFTNNRMGKGTAICCCSRHASCRQGPITEQQRFPWMDSFALMDWDFCELSVDVASEIQ